MFSKVRIPAQKIILIFCVCCALLMPTLAYSVADSTIVYVTPTGTKYHRANCSYTGTVTSMTIEEAENSGYGPCSRCHPNRLTGPYSRPEQRSSSGKQKSSSPESHSPQSAVNTKSSFPYVLLLVGCIVIPILIYPVYSFFTSIRIRRAEAAKRRAFQHEKNVYTMVYGGIAPEALMPPEVEIGEDGLPKEAGAVGWGDKFTFYTTYSGQAFHRVRGCSGSYTATHAIHCTSRYPCSRCNPQLPDLSWFAQYQEIRQIKHKYSID